MDVLICVGSSCHVKGSYDIINLMQEALKSNNLEDKVNVAGAFCLGACGKGVSIKVGENVISDVFAANFDEVFKEHVLDKL